VKTSLVPNLERIQTYVEPLLEDSDVRRHLKRSATDLRAAIEKVRDAKPKQRRRNLRLYLLLAVVTAIAAAAVSKERRP
jgi:hypothetical protein